MIACWCEQAAGKPSHHLAKHDVAGLNCLGCCVRMTSTDNDDAAIWLWGRCPDDPELWRVWYFIDRGRYVINEHVHKQACFSRKYMFHQPQCIFSIIPVPRGMLPQQVLADQVIEETM